MPIDGREKTSLEVLGETNRKPVSQRRLPRTEDQIEVTRSRVSGCAVSSTDRLLASHSSGVSKQLYSARMCRCVVLGKRSHPENSGSVQKT